ncbi:PqiC family protein [Allopusillimonas ginsengisoli]|uniref:PqiC family protein n=1 Tax=Allopusillimonas ginsengisoli TaxID=453575 RepID=UPI001020E01B|nr:PqiC family protein [Allopusillimonas ginsengisoli]TEA78060.1 membrane integrity-associated transporter subunit PqiC [Allopusillimonas ginsengisoli]
MKRINALAALSLCVLLAACAGMSESHYYSLMPSAGPLEAHGSDSSEVKRATGASQATPGYAISVDTVSVPEQVDRPQIVLTDPDSTQVTPLNAYLWASTLSEELRAALADDLSRRLNVIELPAKSVPASLGLWKVDMRVQRFESLYGRHAVLEATWRLRPVNISGRQALLCQVQVVVPVGEGVSSLVHGHQEALAAMSGLIASAIEGKAIQAMNASPAAESRAQVRVKGCARG